MSIYDSLRDMLAASQLASIKMSFAEIEVLLGRSLPKSAYEYDAWWSNEDPTKTTHSHSRAWTTAGYDAEPHRMQRVVTFRRRD
ncbi:hypothetical protein [Bradyrhizobium sp. RD5-C2]|uniref:DUF7662 domain-containing protein n=1 Tax=Bradyrhizobium sp. RD5-C2 TaxID=244562 RepID=UPI001CC34F94|nr:hypothetical protein [Bradyrhizobium sp. RD5-C2]